MSAGSRASVPAEPYTIEKDGTIIRLAGDLRMHDASAIWKSVRAQTDGATGALTFDPYRWGVP